MFEPTGAGRVSRARAGLRKLGLDLRSGEGAPLVLLFLAFFFIICFFYVSRTVRESEFLENLGSHWLPVVNLALALASYPVIRLFNAWSERVEKHTLLIASSVVISATMVLFWWALQFDSPGVVLGFYVWNGMLGVLLVSRALAARPRDGHLDPPRGPRRLGRRGARSDGHDRRDG
jgi:hypothetical protein